MTRYFHVVLNNKFTKLLSIDYWRHIGRSAIVYGECICIYIDYKKYWRTQSAPGWFVQGKNVTGWHHQGYIFIDPVDTDNWTLGMSTDTVVFTCEYSETIFVHTVEIFYVDASPSIFNKENFAMRVTWDDTTEGNLGTCHRQSSLVSITTQLVGTNMFNGETNCVYHSVLVVVVYFDRIWFISREFRHCHHAKACLFSVG